MNLIQLWFWLFFDFIAWLFIGCIGCLIFPVLMLIMHGQEVGFGMIENLISQDHNYLIQMAHTDVHLPSIAIPQPLQSLLPYANVILLGLSLLMIRLYLLLRWCPLFLLLGLIGLIDGLAQRSIRRASAGRESALIYHQSKALVRFSLILGIFIDLVLPVQAEQSEWILVTAAILFGLAIQATAKSFKKYL